MENSRFNPYPFLVTGVFFATVLAALTHWKVEIEFLYIWVSLFGLMTLFSLDTARSKIRLVIFSPLISLIAALTLNWSNANSIPLFQLLFVFTFAINAYHIAYQKDGLPFNYDSLFHGVWDTFVKLVTAWLFTGLAWGLLLMWSELFKLIGIKLFEKIFSLDWFIVFFTAFMVAIGLTISAYLTVIIRQLRNFLLLIFKILLPVLSFVGILFAVSSIVITALYQQPPKFDYFIYSAMSYYGIIFINAVYQKGGVTRPYSQWLLWLVNAFILVLPIYSIFALVGLFHDPLYFKLPITIAGFHADNFNQIIVSFLLLIYSLAYAVCVFSLKGKWMAKIQKSNIILGLAVIMIVMLTNNYWFKLKPSPNETTTVEGHYELVDQNLAHSGIFWKSPVDIKAGSNIVRYTVRNSKPIHICRFQVNSKYYVGSVEKNQCQGVIGAKSGSSRTYELLISKQNNVIWGFNPEQIILRQEGKKIVHICRVIHDDQIRIGETGNDFRIIQDDQIRISETRRNLKCIYAVDGKIFKKTYEDILSFK